MYGGGGGVHEVNKSKLTQQHESDRAGREEGRHRPAPQ